MQFNKDSGDIIDSLQNVKIASKVFYNILSLNVYGVLMQSITHYNKIVKAYSYIKSKIKYSSK